MEHEWEYGASFAYCSVCKVIEGLTRDQLYYYKIENGHLVNLKLTKKQRNNYKCTG